MVDPDRVRRLLTSLLRWRAVLVEEPGHPLARRYAVQAAAQAAIDVANHVIASEGWRVPQDYGDAFRVLAEHGVITDALAERFRALTGLRNLLVHLYDDVDDERVAREVRGGLSDLADFSRAVARLTQATPDGDD